MDSTKIEPSEMLYSEYSVDGLWERTRNRAAIILFKYTEAMKPLGLFGKIDHICYKCSHSNEYDSLRKQIEVPGQSNWVYQSFISGRRTAVIKLVTPICGIYVLELSDQKPDLSQRSGWDHVEVRPHTGIFPVVTYDDMSARVQKVFPGLKAINRSHHPTHDVVLFDNFKLRLTRESLVEKIKHAEML